MSILAAMGPYLAYGIGGKGTGKKFVNDPFNPGDELGFNLSGTGKRFDFGLQFGAGVEFQRIILMLGTQIGLADLSNSINMREATGGLLDGLPTDFIPGFDDLLDQTLDDKNRNISFYLTVGYRF